MNFVRASTSGGGVGSDSCTAEAPGETRFCEYVTGAWGMSAFKRAFKSRSTFGLEGLLLRNVATLGFGCGEAVGATCMGLGGTVREIEFAGGAGRGERAALGPALFAVPRLLEMGPVGAALGIPEAGRGACVALTTDGPGDFAGAAVTTARAVALAAGAGVTSTGEALGAASAGTGDWGTGDAGVFVGTALGAAVGGVLREAIGTVLGRLSGTATMDCCGRGTNTGSFAAGLGGVEASGTGFTLEGPCATIFASS